MKYNVLYDNENSESKNKKQYNFPQTRYQGSKMKIMDWIDKYLKEYNYSTALDLFSGSGVVSYYFKTRNKKVTANDILRSSFTTAKVFIENNNIKLNKNKVEEILNFVEYDEHRHIIESNFDDIYFTKEENIWLDAIIHNINRLTDEYETAIANWALFQSCIIKRPYNLFHRKNLYMRLDDVSRSFGNKTTWDGPFKSYFLKFIKEANNAIFDNKQKNIASNMEANDVMGDFDLIYLDPPYSKMTGQSNNNYQDYYHFLEGILSYDDWQNNINQNRKHKPLNYRKSSWIDKNKLISNFEDIINKFQNSKIVISYNTEGIPSEDTLMEIVGTYKNNISIHKKEHRYVLKNQKNKSKEILIIGTD